MKRLVLSLSTHHRGAGAGTRPCGRCSGGGGAAQDRPEIVLQPQAAGSAGASNVEIDEVHALRHAARGRRAAKVQRSAAGALRRLSRGAGLEALQVAQRGGGLRGRGALRGADGERATEEVLQVEGQKLLRGQRRRLPPRYLRRARRAWLR